ncbi:MAG: glycosyltransferase family 2 protein [Ferruginibacter sp.]|uniref:glycosyltransferase family 2 protein n=1 Tax=Ferruginibacter sp. TaxID=1940288 RepID=UPI002659B842|nr:glycosyltransferase family 2 protein [Ferruginibacter sp.]MDB5279441.1 glycosyltransferase family 2 protein [Ferruginibacter sp.]
MDVSIIIINYKSAKLVMDCVASIYEQTHQYSFEIIVVDNDSQDGLEEKLKAGFPAIRWLQTGYNAGFARANNAGIRIALGDYVLILNADTIIKEGAIDKNLALIKQYSDAVGSGVQLLNTDGTNQISGAHFVKGGLNTLLPLPYLGKLIRYLGYRFKSTVPSVQTIKDKIEVDWVVGAYILVKKEVLQKAGLMDEDFFMYAEEIEWCSRLRKQGKLYLFAEPKVIHIGGGTSSDYYTTTENENSKNLWNKKGRQIIVSNMLRIRKQFGIGWFLLIAGTYFIEIPLFFICLLLHKIFTANKATYTFKNWIDYVKNMGVLLRYCFKILLNKPYFYKVA